MTILFTALIMAVLAVGWCILADSPRSEMPSADRPVWLCSLLMLAYLTHRIRGPERPDMCRN